MKVKLRATVTFTEEYEADSKYYGNCEHAIDMIQMDVKNCNDDPLTFISNMIENGGKMTVKIVKVK